MDKICECRYLIAERGIENLVGPHIEELAEAGVTTIYYDQTSIESLSDRTPLPESRRDGIRADEVRNLIYTSGKPSLYSNKLMYYLISSDDIQVPLVFRKA